MRLSIKTAVFGAAYATDATDLTAVAASFVSHLLDNGSSAYLILNCHFLVVNFYSSFSLYLRI